VTDQLRTPGQAPLRCDRCGIRALVSPAVEQPLFHVFDDGVLCDDCYRCRRGKLP
jgi:hypothetical protein